VIPGPADIFDVTLVLTPVRKGHGIEVTLRSDAALPVSAVVEGRDIRSAKTLATEWRTGGDVSPTELSEELGRCLLPGPIAEELRRIQLANSPKRLRVWIESDDPSLMVLPWEAAQAIHDETETGTLAGYPGISVVRRSHTPQKAQPPRPTGDRLVVSVAAGARVLDDGTNRLPPLKNVVDELRQLAPTIDFHLKQDVELGQLPDLLAGAHIFCFNGHAVEQKGERVLLLHGPAGTSPTLSVGQLGDLLPPGSDPRVVILDACATGSLFSDHKGWSELGADVMIAWQREMTPTAVTAFARGFYEELHRTGDLDEAIREGREKLATSTGDPHAPVVFCRYTGGRISLAPNPPAHVEPPNEATGSKTSTSPSSERSQSTKAGPRRPLVRWQPHDPTAAVLTDWLDRTFLEATRLTYASPRYITPYIGPGVLQTDPTSEEIHWDTRLAAAMAADHNLAAFVEPLLTDPMGGRLQGRTLLERDPATPVEESASTVRIAMARLAEQATSTFVKAELADAVPLNLWDRHSIPIAEGSPLMARLDAARSALLEHQAIDADDRLLGAARLRTRLDQLRAHLISPGGGLSGASVAWLTDLFWHTVVFDSPLYPHISELSLQVSLLAGQRNQPTRSLDPATVVARTELSEMSAATARSVARGYNPDESAGGPRRRLHRAIADVLHADYERWCRSPLASETNVVPFALTTAFDLEMERGLAASDRSYEVAIPIYTRLENPKADDDQRPVESVCWLVGRFDPCVDPALDDLIRPATPWRLAASLKMLTDSPDRPVGPLLIKLNGSPSHVLPADPANLGLIKVPTDDDVTRPAAGHPEGFGSMIQANGGNLVLAIEHAVSLGEYDFLQVTRMAQYSFHRVKPDPNDKPDEPEPPDGLPESIVSQIIRPERFWMLLGHRFADWNSRAQIHTFIAHESRHTDRGCAVAQSFDTDRLLFLDWLGITRASGEMRDLIEPLERAAQNLRDRQ
jgi:hypothetical protein